MNDREKIAKVESILDEFAANLDKNPGASFMLIAGFAVDVIKQLPDSVGGWFNLRGCTLPEGLKLPDVKGQIYK